MTRRLRYSLIISGLLFFLLSAPVLVLFVQGKTFSLAGRQTSLTGIIAADTRPKGANIFIDNQKQTQTPGAVRFVKPGEHLVEIKKTGYYDWQKTLSVLPGRVTLVHPNPAPLQLLRKTEPKLITAEARAFWLTGPYLLYQTQPDNRLVVISARPTDQSVTTFAVPDKITDLLADTDAKQIIILGGHFTLQMNLKNMSLTTLPLITEQPKNIHSGLLWTTSKDGALRGFSITNYTATQKPAISVPDVKTSLIFGRDLYFLQAGEGGLLTLKHANILEGGIEQEQTLLSALPDKDYQIFLDNSKAVFLLADHALSRLGKDLQIINRDVTNVNTKGGVLAYATKSGELWWYDSGSDKTHLITREQGEFFDFYVNPSLQYACVLKKDGLVALEMADNFGQNRYRLDQSEFAPGSELVVAGDNTLFYNNGTQIKTLATFR